MTLHDVSAERLAGAQGRLDVDGISGAEPAERGAVERFRHGVEGERAAGRLDDRQADAADRDRVAHGGLGRRSRRLDQEAHAAAAGFERGDAAALAHDAGEHPAKATASGAAPIPARPRSRAPAP